MGVEPLTRFQVSFGCSDHLQGDSCWARQNDLSYIFCKQFFIKIKSPVSKQTASKQGFSSWQLSLRKNVAAASHFADSTEDDLPLLYSLN